MTHPRTAPRTTLPSQPRAARQVNKQYRHGQLAILDVFTSMRVYSNTFAVYYNDIKGATGATVYGDLVSHEFVCACVCVHTTHTNTMLLETAFEYLICMGCM